VQTHQQHPQRPRSCASAPRPPGSAWISRCTLRMETASRCHSRKDHRPGVTLRTPLKSRRGAATSAASNDIQPGLALQTCLKTSRQRRLQPPRGRFNATNAVETSRLERRARFLHHRQARGVPRAAPPRPWKSRNRPIATAKRRWNRTEIPPAPPRRGREIGVARGRDPDVSSRTRQTRQKLQTASPKSGRSSLLINPDIDDT
jgi:hypothetical protein